MTQTQGETQSFALDHCTALVKAADEDLWLCLPYVDRADRLRVAALYALAVELRRIPAAVSEAPLGEIRLQWWRDAMDEILDGRPPRAHPVVQALAVSGAVDQHMRDTTERGIEARARLLYGEPFQNAAELGLFFAEAEGWLAEALDPKADPAQIIAKSGAYGLARWSPALTTPLSDCPLDRARALARESRNLALTAPTAYLSLIRGYLARPGGASWPLGKRLALLKTVAAQRT